MNDESMYLEVIFRWVFPTIIYMSVFFLIGWVASLLIAALKNRTNIRRIIDFHDKLLDKFGSASEFITYLETPAGQKFFESLAENDSVPLNKTLNLTIIGIILFAVALGLIPPSIIYRDIDKGLFTVFCLLVFSLGIGFLASAFVSYRLLKSWGSIPAAKRADASE